MIEKLCSLYIKHKTKMRMNSSIIYAFRQNNILRFRMDRLQKPASMVLVASR